MMMQKYKEKMMKALHLRHFEADLIAYHFIITQLKENLRQFCFSKLFSLQISCLIFYVGYVYIFLIRLFCIFRL